MDTPAAAVDELAEHIAFLDRTLAELRENGRRIAKALRQAPPLLLPGNDGRLYIMGGNRFTRWLLTRRTRREILNPPGLLWYEPVIFGPTRQDLELRQAVGSFNEGLGWRRGLIRARLAASREERAVLRPGRLPA